jgi:uncharacterized protein (UPF0335 family)
MSFDLRSPHARLVNLVQKLEHLEQLKQHAAENLKAGFELAAADGFDITTLKVVLRLRRMTPEQRRERRALEAIYMAGLGMLEGDALPESARRRFSEAEAPPPPPPSEETEQAPQESQAPPPAQPQLALKDPAEARQEGTDAALAGKRIYDNPYPAGDPCRAAWDEGWCAQQQSHGMETPAAYQRRGAKPKDDKRDKGGAGSGDVEKGAA